MSKIIDHRHPLYKRIWQTSRSGVKYNGAYYYSCEIVNNIIPNVKTKRNWVTVHLHGYCYDNSIVFIHNNKRPEIYRWLRKYKNLVLVCGVESTVDKVKDYGEHVFYLPLSIDVDDVKQYASEKTKDVAYVGRRSKARGCALPQDINYLANLPRRELLVKMAEFKKVYAVGRCAVEAKALSCEVLPFDPRYPDPSIWKVLDNADAAKMLQERLDKIDG